jgi:hypothetical protein
MGSVPAGAAAADSPTRQSALRGCDAAYTPTWSSAERIVAHLVTPPAHFWASPTSVHLRFTSVALTSRPSPLGPSPPAHFAPLQLRVCGATPLAGAARRARGGRGHGGGAGRQK